MLKKTQRGIVKEKDTNRTVTERQKKKEPLIQRNICGHVLTLKSTI